MSRLTRKFPWLKEQITLKNWELALIIFIANILGDIIFDFLRWLF